MSDYELIHDVNLGQRPKETKEPGTDSHDHTHVAKAIEHGRPDTLGATAAMHIQRAAGNAAMGALVQRSNEEESPVRDVIGKGGGTSLDSGVRQKMESSFGRDFGDVRVHTGPAATQAATSVQAQAFTVGNEVVFNEGKYNPSTPEGQRTVAHELSHVVQQGEGSVPGEERADGIKVSDPGDWAEQQAEATADAVMSGGGAHAGHDHGAGAGGASVQTLPIQRVGDAVEEEKPEELQALRDETIQREGEEEEEPPA